MKKLYRLLTQVPPNSSPVTRDILKDYKKENVNLRCANNTICEFERKRYI